MNLDGDGYSPPIFLGESHSRLSKRLKEAEAALRFYAEGGSDLEPRAEKAHLYDKEYPVGSEQWRKRSMSDYQTGRRAREYFKKYGVKWNT